MREVSLVEEDDTQLSINEVREDIVKLEAERRCRQRRQRHARRRLANPTNRRETL